MKKEKQLLATRGETKLYYSHTETTPYEVIVHGFVEKDGIETPVNVESVLRLGYWTPAE